MSDSTTKKMLRAYESFRAPSRFLSNLFVSPPENYFNSEEVEIDIIRNEEDVSVALHNLSSGYRENLGGKYTNKSFKPQIHKEAFSLNAFEMIKRAPGRNPFEDVSAQLNAINQTLRGTRNIEAKINRAKELQVSQVLQTAVVDSKDASGNTIFTLDFKGKATHFPQVSTSWSNAGADIVGDILSLCRVINKDGQSKPNTAIFGETAFENMLKNTELGKRFNFRRADTVNILPMREIEGGGEFRGRLEVGSYSLDLWTYSEVYKDPQTGNKLEYLNTNKVIILDIRARKDLVYGSIPRIVESDPRLRFLTGRLARQGRTDLFINPFVSNDNENVSIGVGTRFLAIPTAIDTYGCINTVQA